MPVSQALAARDPVTSPVSRVFATGPVTIRIQSVLFNNDLAGVHKALCSVARAAELVSYTRTSPHVSVRFGDGSPSRLIDDATLIAWQHEFGNAIEIGYDYFNGNLGSARGHNRLAEQAEADFLLIQNPDVVMAPRTLDLLIEPFRRPGPGLVEAKQLPIEHPKDYDVQTGATAWASTACMMIPRALFNEIGGFDADSFFLYCDDVDLSWMVREAGYAVLFQPAACVFHDKRLSKEGKWQASTPEIYYSAEAAMVLAHKWSRSDLADSIYKHFVDNGGPLQKRAAAEFDRRRQSGQLPKPRDPNHRIATFVEDFYAHHRYLL